MADVTLIRGDTARVVQVALLDGDDPMDLSGATVTLSYAKIDWEGRTHKAGRTRTMAVTDAAGGIAQYQFEDGDFPDGDGTYSAEVTVENDGTVTTPDRFQIRVLDRLDQEG